MNGTTTRIAFTEGLCVSTVQVLKLIMTAAVSKK